MKEAKKKIIGRITITDIIEILVGVTAGGIMLLILCLTGAG
jgi:hypothetical protein